MHSVCRCVLSITSSRLCMDTQRSCRSLGSLPSRMGRWERWPSCACCAPMHFRRRLWICKPPLSPLTPVGQAKLPGQIAYIYPTLDARLEKLGNHGSFLDHLRRRWTCRCRDQCCTGAENENRSLQVGRARYQGARPRSRFVHQSTGYLRKQLGSPGVGISSECGQADEEAGGGCELCCTRTTTANVAPN